MPQRFLSLSHSESFLSIIKTIDTPLIAFAILYSEARKMLKSLAILQGFPQILVLIKLIYLVL